MAATTAALPRPLRTGWGPPAGSPVGEPPNALLVHRASSTRGQLRLPRLPLLPPSAHLHTWQFCLDRQIKEELHARRSVAGCRGLSGRLRCNAIGERYKAYVQGLPADSS